MLSPNSILYMGQWGGQGCKFQASQYVLVRRGMNKKKLQTNTDRSHLLNVWLLGSENISIMFLVFQQTGCQIFVIWKDYSFLCYFILISFQVKFIWPRTFSTPFLFHRIIFRKWKLWNTDFWRVFSIYLSSHTWGVKTKAGKTGRDPVGRVKRKEILNIQSGSSLEFR